MTTPTNNLQVSPYLKTQWQFPYEDLRDLANQSDISYIEIASKMNARTIGTYSVNFPLVTGERWYTATPTNPQSNQPQQTLRQVYTFTGAGNIAHEINFSAIAGFTKCYGSYTDGTNWYGVIFATSVGIAGQVTFYVTPTNIVVAVDGGAPAVTSGLIWIEWLSQF